MEEKLSENTSNKVISATKKYDFFSLIQIYNYFYSRPRPNQNGTHTHPHTKVEENVQSFRSLNDF